jgi:hypothetical protein
MKTLILATALLGATAIIPAAAGYSCGWQFNRWVCNNDYASGGGSVSCGWQFNRWVCR